MGKEIYKLTIEPITCVHIGTGKQLSLLDYTVKETESGISKYIHFSADSILNRIVRNSAKINEFDVASSSGNMKDLQIFFQENFSEKDDSVYGCETTKEFFETYLKNKALSPYENSALVEQMYRPAGADTPVIPGSSLKGCIRTAILNALLSETDDITYNKYADFRDKNIEDNCGNQKKLEREFDKLNSQIQKELLSNYDNAKKDPFRAIEFSDCSFLSKNCQIVGLLKTVSTNHHSGELFVSNSTQIQIEAIKGLLMGHDVGAQCLLRLNADLMNQINGVTKAFDINDIVCSCNYFYWREFKIEYEKFYKEASVHCDLITDLYKELNEVRAKENQFVIRVGRWSQVEFTTLDKNIRAPKNKKYGTTRTIFNYDEQYLPLGWCKCSVERM